MHLIITNHKLSYCLQYNISRKFVGLGCLVKHSIQSPLSLFLFLLGLLPFSGNHLGYRVVVLLQALLGTMLLVQQIVVMDMLVA